MVLLMTTSACDARAHGWLIIQLYTTMIMQHGGRRRVMDAACGPWCTRHLHGRKWRQHVDLDALLRAAVLMYSHS